ncbi:hypothetical protein [Streptomyces sp. NPDC058891]|uniref:hypothetical protein n=1 Tax=Streptomyces sp. NPDC058891 TaxID=3346667 RepID=UPI00369A8681
MTDQTPSRPAYELPDSGALGAAALESLKAVEKANDRLGRVMAVVTAAAMRDILTDFDHSAPFDAARVQLVEGEDGSLFPTGRYWTAAGEERMFADADGLGAIHDMSEWTRYLSDENRDVWLPLCDELPDLDRRPTFALDLVKAAALPID